MIASFSKNEYTHTSSYYTPTGTRVPTTSRIGILNPSGAPLLLGSELKLKWVLAIQIGKFEKPWSEKSKRHDSKRWMKLLGEGEKYMWPVWCIVLSVLLPSRCIRPRWHRRSTRVCCTCHSCSHRTHDKKKIKRARIRTKNLLPLQWLQSFPK